MSLLSTADTKLMPAAASSSVEQSVVLGSTRRSIVSVATASAVNLTVRSLPFWLARVEDHRHRGVDDERGGHLGGRCRRGERDDAHRADGESGHSGGCSLYGRSVHAEISLDVIVDRGGAHPGEPRLPEPAGTATGRTHSCTDDAGPLRVPGNVDEVGISGDPRRRVDGTGPFGVGDLTPVVPGRGGCSSGAVQVPLNLTPVSDDPAARPERRARGAPTT